MMENMSTPADCNDDYHEEDKGYDMDRIWKSVRVMSMVLFGLACALGVSGNGAVIWATGFRMKKTVSTVWYLNLAVTDLLVTAFLPLDIAYNALDYHWPFGRFMCKMDGLAFFANKYASIFTLLVISVDRCVCVVCPLWARCSGYRTVGKASCASLGVWVLALALALSSRDFILRDTERVGDKVRCYNNYALVAVYDSVSPEEYQLHTFRFRAMVVTRFVLGFVVPFSVIVSCYSVIVCRLRNRPLGGRQSGRSFRIIATVIAVFFLCWAPFHVVWLIDVLFYRDLKGYSETMAVVIGLLKPITAALALLNSCLNPLLYVFSQGFKDVFRRRNVLKVLEKALAESSASAQHSHRRSCHSSNETEGSTCPPGTQDPSGDCPV